jgi:hypothetical protein
MLNGTYVGSFLGRLDDEEKLDKSLPKQGAEATSKENSRGLRYRRERSTTPSIHGIRKVDQSNNRNFAQIEIDVQRTGEETWYYHEDCLFYDTRWCTDCRSVLIVASISIGAETGIRFMTTTFVLFPEKA